MLGKKMVRFVLVLLAILLLLPSCGEAANMTAQQQTPQESQTAPADSPADPSEEPEPDSLPPSPTESEPAENAKEDAQMLTIQIGDQILTAALENNPSAQALQELLAEGPLSVSVQNYGGFEKVGTLPQSLPRDDVQTTTAPGDIMLYQGDSIVLFYGSNTWSYTKLGTITGCSEEELRAILGGDDTIISLSITSSSNPEF